MGRELITHQLLAYGIADHAETGEPWFDRGFEAIFRRDWTGHGSGPYRHDRPIHLGPGDLSHGPSEIGPTEEMRCNVLLG